MVSAKIMGVAVLGTGLVLGSTFYIGYQSGSDSKVAAQLEALALAQSRTAESSKLQQQEINDAIQQQLQNQNAIGDRLSADLIRLRERQSASVPRAAGTSCEGSNGSELAREHAEFLVRYGAKAAEQDAGLTACYAALDAVKRSYERCKAQ